MNKPKTYISLFSSAGVGCYGFKLNGFECIATNEIIAKRLKIQTFNNKCKYDTGYISGDITQPEVKSKLFDEINYWKKKHKVNEPDVIIATPPCQGMSVANHKKKNELGRNSLVIESIKITKDVLPKFFIFENVRAFLNTVCTDIDGIDKPIRAAINHNLGGEYNILFKVINFKEVGSDSSRTRTLVIGVRKDLPYITPFDLFPSKQTPKNLKKLISDLPILNNMGEIDENDIFHASRKFAKRMLPWIETLEEGQSAFENTETHRIPHQVIKGEIVFNKSKNGDKYARWYWNRVGPCVHTRNDILSSQNTIHPSQNRVFSIRELMRMMTIPESFQWANQPVEELNKLSVTEKKAFLKKEELNIRHCLGEAVPTRVFGNIAKKISVCLKRKFLSTTQLKNLITKEKLSQTDNLIDFINKSFKKFSFGELLRITELSNANRQETAAYFTRADIAFSVIKDLPIFKSKKTLKILEPSVGIGNFLPLLFKKYEHIASVTIDVCDIDKNSLEVLKMLLSKISIPKNFTINFIHDDFLLFNNQIKYDLVIGNPPYGKITNNKQLLSSYKAELYNQNTNNIFSFFIEKCISKGKFVALVVPKSLLNAPEFDKTRLLLLQHNLLKICDYGEKGFKGVKIETISFILETTSKKNDTILIESYINKSYLKKSKQYIFSNDFPYWLIYRNDAFDAIVNKMKLGIFKSFRDRQITKAITKQNGEIRVLKSRNIGDNEIINKGDYDCYIDEMDNLAVAKFLNQKDVVLVPNLTYYPRATFLPKNAIADGSVALLTLKNGSQKPTKKDLAFYGTKDFEMYYRVARNYGTRSLNIDKNSVYFFGLLKDNENDKTPS